MKRMDELVGIIQGIDTDNVINKRETEAIIDWMDRNYELKNKPISKDVFKMLDEILEDKEIDDREKELLLDYANDYIIEHDTTIETLNVLSGIVEGIVCDDVVNEKEVHSLHRWLKSNRKLEGEPSFDLIFGAVEKILEDRIITQDERDRLLELFSQYITDKKSAMNLSKSIVNEVGASTTDNDRDDIDVDYESMINALLSDQKTIYVVKGVRRYSSYNYKLERLYSLDINDAINEGEYDEREVLNDLITKIQSNTSYVISYEEFCMLPVAFLQMLPTFNYKIRVLENNLYHEFFPLVNGVNKRNVAKGLDKDKETIVKRIWDECLLMGGRLFVSYQPIESNADADIEYVDIIEGSDYCTNLEYSDEDDVYDFGNTEESYLLTLEDIALSENKELSVITGKSGLLSYQSKLLRTLTTLGYTVRLIHRAIKKLDDERMEEYEAILKRKNENYSFRLIDFYVDPGFTLETEKVSQGEVVSSLVTNAIGAYRNEKYNDVFVTAPTGSGKSILFQIPAIYLAEQYELLTIVVTPLIGLMNDQVNNIEALTDKAATINSDYTPEEKEIIKEQIQSGEKSILYVSPETLLSNNPIKALIGERKIGLFVVDEAHIVTTWGKSFRPDYWYLGDYISFLRQRGGYQFPIATFSATVTYGGNDDMHSDLIDSLRMKTGKYEYVAPMRRDDISFIINVVEKENDYLDEKNKKVEEALKSFSTSGEKTISYFPYVRHIKDFYDFLMDEKCNNVYQYYGGLDKTVKNQNMQDFADGNDGVMLATKAFGMGIDIDDIEVVYHFAPTGNLCDYVQEIGRAARDESIQGYAQTDFFMEDFRYIKQLYGMSAITNYHIRAILLKLKSVYKEYGKRNFTISPDDFAYIFPNSRDFGEVEANLKTAVLMIQKDFELNPAINFKPLIFKPRSMFTRGYLLISDEDYKRIEKSRFRKYFTRYAETSELSNESVVGQRVWDDNTKSYRIEEVKQTTTYTRDIYAIDFKKMWDECFDDLTFGNFKRMFFEGELTGFEYSSNFRQKYILTIKTKMHNLGAVKDKLEILIDEIVEIFSRPEIGSTHLSQSDVAHMLCEIGVVNMTYDEAMPVAESLINVINSYNTDAQFIGYRPFAYNFSTGKYNIKSQQAIKTRLGKIKRDYKGKFIDSFNRTEKTFIIDDFSWKGDHGATKSNEMQIAQLLEAFNLASYRVVSGERPEYFVRINSITQIDKILDNPSYSSQMIQKVRERHEASIEMMDEFFTVLNSDSERWDYIERYFVGMPFNHIDNDETEEDYRQLVKHKRFGTGYVIESNEKSIVVQFDNEDNPKKFGYPAIFEDGFMQRLN